MDDQQKKPLLPPPTPIAGLDPEKPLQLLTQMQRDALQKDLDQMAKVRRQAEAKSGNLKLS
jgi:hypothetical protein